MGSARAASLPPDGLLCNYTTHLCHGQRLQGYEFCIRLKFLKSLLPQFSLLLNLGIFLRTRLLLTSRAPTPGRGVNRWKHGFICLCIYHHLQCHQTRRPNVHEQHQEPLAGKDFVGSTVEPWCRQGSSCSLLLRNHFMIF